MLKVFRDNLKSWHWVLWFVIIVFVGLVFVDYRNVGGPETDTAIWVGDEKIGVDEFKSAVDEREQQIRQLYQDRYDNSMRTMIEGQVTQELVRNKLLEGEAISMGLTVTSKEVQEAVLNSQGLQDESGKFVGFERYAEILARSPYKTPERFEKAVRKDLLLRKLQTIMATSVFVSDAEVETALRSQNEKATIRYLAVPRTTFASEAVASQAELEEYFAANQETYRLPEQRVVSYLMVEEPRLRSELTFSDEELLAFYNSNQADFEQQERVRARHILLRVNEERTVEQAKATLDAVRQRVASGGDFGTEARTLSEDSGSKDRAGDLGYFARGAMTPEFETAAFEGATGSVVGPISTPFGEHLIEILDHQQGGLQPFEEVRTRVTNRLAAERVTVEADKLAAELLATINQATDKHAAMEAAAEGKAAVRFAQTTPFGQQDVVPGIGRSNEFADATFTLEAGQLAEAPVRTTRGPALVLLEKVQEPRLPELSEVVALVRQATEEERQKTVTAQRVEAAGTEVRSGSKSLDQLAADLGLVVQESGSFGSDGSIAGLGQAPGVIEAALTSEVGAIGGPVDYTLGSVLFEVTERLHWDPATASDQRNATRTSLEQEKRFRLEDALIQQRTAQSNVRYNPNYFSPEQTPGAPGTR